MRGSAGAAGPRARTARREQPPRSDLLAPKTIAVDILSLAIKMSKEALASSSIAMNQAKSQHDYQASRQPRA